MMVFRKINKVSSRTWVNGLPSMFIFPPCLKLKLKFQLMPMLIELENKAFAQIRDIFLYFTN